MSIQLIRVGDGFTVDGFIFTGNQSDRKLPKMAGSDRNKPDVAENDEKWPEVTSQSEPLIVLKSTKTSVNNHYPKWIQNCPQAKHQN